MLCEISLVQTCTIRYAGLLCNEADKPDQWPEYRLFYFTFFTTMIRHSHSILIVLKATSRYYCILTNLLDVDFFKMAAT